MTVYVDNMRAPLGRLIMCHMLADTPSELHAMAAAIGVRGFHHQGDHYDVCLSKRALAVKAGAVEISKRVAAVMMRNKRDGFPMGTVSAAMALIRRRKIAAQSRAKGLCTVSFLFIGALVTGLIGGAG